MRLPRKKKKKLKKGFHLKKRRLSKEALIIEYIWAFNRPLLAVLNSLIYQDAPSRQELIDYWSDLAKGNKRCIQHLNRAEGNMFKQMPKFRENITKYYIKRDRQKELNSIINLC